ncbi:MAG: hypothetical protein AAFU85_05345 [Planctomycetota bacterium]
MRPYVVIALVRKDFARLVRNGPALMLLGMFVLVGILVASSGLGNDQEQNEPADGSPNAGPGASWIVYLKNEDPDWIRSLKRRTPREFDIRFVEVEQFDADAYPANVCVIELHEPRFFADRQQIRRPIHYRYPGADPQVLWPVSRWFLSASLEYFGKMGQFFETSQPLTQPTQAAAARNALANVSVADILSVTLIGTALLTTIQFFSACGLLVSLTAQERERGALRALLLTPATYFEFIASKAFVHIGLAIATSAMVVAAIQPATLGSPLLWGTMIGQTCGYFSVGLLIASFAKNQAAPNLLTFGYLLAVGTLYLLAYRFQAFQILSALTFERYGLVLTVASLNLGDLGLESSINAMRSTQFRMLILLSGGLFLIATAVGSSRLRA